MSRYRSIIIFSAGDGKVQYFPISGGAVSTLPTQGGHITVVSMGKETDKSITNPPAYNVSV